MNSHAQDHFKLNREAYRATRVPSAASFGAPPSDGVQATSQYLSCVRLASALFLASWNVPAQVIDFEHVPGQGEPFEGMLISDQYLATQGVSFVLEDGSFPQIAMTGPPTAGFEGPDGGDTPVPGQGIGSYFLTDDGELGGGNPPALIVQYAEPTAVASGVILDIDFTETFTIDARDAADNVLATVEIAAGDPDTGDGIATFWSFDRPLRDIYSIRFEGRRDNSGFGLGFDLFDARSIGVIGGMVLGIRPTRVYCENVTTGQSTAVDTNDELWDCSQVLEFSADDEIRTAVRGNVK